MSLEVNLGKRGNILEVGPQNASQVFWVPMFLFSVTSEDYSQIGFMYNSVFIQDIWRNVTKYLTYDLESL